MSKRNALYASLSYHLPGCFPQTEPAATENLSASQ